ncbi:MAG: class I SAM-dependent methyltransferase [Alphaproteobacteria bacterium]
MEAVTYERMAELQRRHWWFVARRRVLEAALRRLPLPADARILELGAGPGGNLEMLSGFGAVSALEPNAFARDTARTLVPDAEIRDGLLPAPIPFEPASFDLVVMLDVLEHVPDDAGSLAAALRMVKPGGRLLLTVPGYPFLWSAHDEAHHHLRRYAWRDLVKLIDAAGWRDIAGTRFMTLLLPLVIVARFVGRLVGREGGDDVMPPAWLNHVLREIFALEAHAVGWRVPLGVSILVTARRPGAAS